MQASHPLLSTWSNTGPWATRVAPDGTQTQIDFVCSSTDLLHRHVHTKCFTEEETYAHSDHRLLLISVSMTSTRHCCIRHLTHCKFKGWKLPTATKALFHPQQSQRTIGTPSELYRAFQSMSEGMLPPRQNFE
eukprot:3511676-Amphidinium_carterae.1